MAKPWCKHYRGMHEKESCEAGVRFDSLAGHRQPGFFDTCPCFGPQGSCEKAEYPTAEEMAARDAEIAERFARVDKARDAIVASLGGPWKRGTQGAHTSIETTQTYLHVSKDGPTAAKSPLEALLRNPPERAEHPIEKFVPRLFTGTSG